MKIENCKLKIQTINSALAWAIRELKETSQSPSLDAEVLLCHVLRKNRGWLYANPEHKLTTKQLNKFKALIRKRTTGWPVAYLTGHKEFYGLDFKVTPDVLIPRPETELLVDLALQKIFPPQEMGRDQGRGRIKNTIDAGTGSGNIIISLAVILSPERSQAAKNLKFYATDSSPKALRIARLNARLYRVSKKIRFLRNNLLENWKLEIGNSLIVANLPYGWSDWKNNTSAETAGLKFEPQQALFTKEQGLYLIHELFKQILTICHPELDSGSSSRFRLPVSLYGINSDRNDKNVVILLEHDPRQKTLLTKLARKYFPYASIKFHKDLSGRFRVCELNF